MEKSQRVKLTVLVAFVALLLLNGTGSPFLGNLGTCLRFSGFRLNHLPISWR